MAREDFAVRGMMPEMDPYEVSPLAVQGPVAAQDQTKANLLATPGVTVVPGSLDDLSRFGGLGGLDGYEANSSGAPQGMPTSYAFPENYGNPKNKIYNLTAGPEDNIRLKFVDGTTMFEGKGPEAAAKAAAIVQELGKKFNTQSTWILDKQTAGGDWKQVSQDTVGEKKKTALNSFLDVVAPIAGALLAVVPGLGLVAVPGLAAGTAGAGLGLSTATAGALGAAGGSLLNSGLQNQNSAEAFKKAALAAASTYIGAKVGDLVKGGVAASSTDPTSAVGIRNLAAKGFSPEQILQQGLKLDPLMKLGDVTGALATKAATTGLAGAAGDVVIKGLTTGAGTAGAVVGGTAAAGLAGAGGLTSGTSGVTNAATNTANNTTAETQSGLDAAADDAATNTVKVTGTGTPVDTNVGLEIAGGLGGNGLTNVFNPVTVNPEPLTITAEPKPVDQTLAVPVTPPVTTPTVNPDFVSKPNDAELKIEADKRPDTQVGLDIAGGLGGNGITSGVNPDFAAKPEEVVIKAEKLPEKVQYKPAAEAAAGIIAANTLVNPADATPKTPVQKTQDWIKAHPLEAASLGLTLIGGLGGAGSGGGSGGGYGGNTLSYPGGGQPGTPGSLTDIFRTKLPTASGLAVTPRDMGQRDWLRYGFGPEASFFSNVPDRQAPLAVNPAPVAQTSPAAQTSPLEVKPNPAPVTTPATTTSTPQTSPLAVNPTPATTQEPKVVGGIANGTRNPDGSGTVWMNGNWAFVDPVLRPLTEEEKLANIARSKANGEKVFADARKDMGIPEGFNFPTSSGIAGMPDLSEKLNEPAPVTSPTPTGVPADGTMLNGNPSVVWDGGVHGGWMQKEYNNVRPSTAEELASRPKANISDQLSEARLGLGLKNIPSMPALSEKLNEPTSDLAVRVDESGMPGPEKITASTPKPASNQYTEAEWAALERSDPTAYHDAIMIGEHGGRMMYARGGSTGGTSHKPRSEFAVHGAGTGRSDDIPAVLSDGEYVMDAETVALLGDGSSKAGAKKLDELRVNLRRHKGANLAKGRFSVNAKSPEKYLAGGRV